MSKNREFFGNNKIGIITYNSVTGLYDLTLNDNSIVSTIRIFNTTQLMSSNSGFFYISPDNKYIYLDGISPSLDIQYLNFCLENGSVTNDQLLDIQLTSSVSTKKIQNETYDVLQLRLSSASPQILSKLKSSVCLNFAYEQDSEVRMNQIKKLHKSSIYTSYAEFSCSSNTGLYLSPAEMFGIKTVDTFTSDTENFQENATGSADSMSSAPPGTVFSCNSNNTEINTYYMYGLTFMNGLLIIISIALILLVFDDKSKKQN
jgi:hypothetical protein